MNEELSTLKMIGIVLGCAVLALIWLYVASRLMALGAARSWFKSKKAFSKTAKKRGGREDE